MSLKRVRLDQPACRALADNLLHVDNDSSIHELSPQVNDQPTLFLPALLHKAGQGKEDDRCVPALCLFAVGRSVGRLAQ